MQRILRLLTTIFFLAIMYLILVDLVSPWVRLPKLGNVGFTAVFVLFSLLHCLMLEGVQWTAIFFAISAIVSFLMEESGVRTGLIYGHYHYSNLLGVKLGHVPVLIPLAWFMMIYPSWVVARALAGEWRERRIAGAAAIAAVGALVMSAWDLVMDPGMAAAGNWVWERGGAYFGVPRRNYLGWLLTTFLVYFAIGLIRRTKAAAGGRPYAFAAMPILVYAFFTLRYIVVSSIPALQVVALFAMGTPAFLALLRYFAPCQVDSRS